MLGLDEAKIPETTTIYNRYKQLLRDVELEGRGHLNKSERKKSDEAYAEERKMAEVCRDFEAIFVQQMLKEMRRGLNEDAILGGATSAADKNRNSFFRDQMYENIAQGMANQGDFGLGSVLFEQLYRQENPELPKQVESAMQVEGKNISTASSVQSLIEQQKRGLQQSRVFTRGSLDQLYGNF